MDQQTNVKAIKIKPKALRMMEHTSSLTELAPREGAWKRRLIHLDRLVRNMAVVGCLVLVVTAVRNSSLPESRSVFEAVQASVGMQWDESLGKLSFVNAVLPQEIQEVWRETSAITLDLPVDGNVVHAWTGKEPYVLIEAENNVVHAVADGEVMSVAHGMEEERIVRIRHEDGSEAVYGNLEKCMVEAGDQVPAGTEIGMLIAQRPLAFELRVNGRSAEMVMGAFAFGE